MNRQITFRIAPGNLAKLDAMAGASGISRSAAINTALSAALSNIELPEQENPMADPVTKQDQRILELTNAVKAADKAAVDHQAVVAAAQATVRGLEEDVAHGETVDPAELATAREELKTRLASQTVLDREAQTAELNRSEAISGLSYFEVPVIDSIGDEVGRRGCFISTAEDSKLKDVPLSGVALGVDGRIISRTGADLSFIDHTTQPEGK